MSINDLPPLPKSLSGINKMLASDSGVLSDVDTEMAKNAKNMELKQMENQKENTINLNHNNYNSINNNHNNNNNSNSNATMATNDSNMLASSINATTMIASAATATAAGVAGAPTTTTTMSTPLKEINGNETISEIPPAIPGSKLDNQIATLRKEMVSYNAPQKNSSK